MDVDASLVDHGNIERTPVLEEREIKELVVDCEVVVCCVVVWRRRGATSGT